MKLLKYIFLFCVTLYSSTHASTEATVQNKQLASLKELAVGVGAGCAEVLVDQPLVYFKNAIQQNQPISLPNFAAAYQKPGVQSSNNLLHELMKSVRVWYAGGLTNVSLVAPQTAVQLFVTGALPAKNKVLNSFLAGAVSGLFSPGELAIIHQQNLKKQGINKNGLEVLQYLVEKYGKQVVFRGLIPMMVRDAGFAGFCFGVQGALKDKTKAYTQNEFVVAFGPGIATGLASAVLTHPFDTVKTKMQVHLDDPQYRSMGSAARAVYNSVISESAANSTREFPASSAPIATFRTGIAQFYKGVGPRGFRILSANIVMGVTAEKLRKLLD